MGSYRNLQVFQLSRKLTVLTYKQVVSKMPPSEIYALSSQIRRAVTSITFNIAEGYGRKTLKDRIHFLYIARGSLYELEAQLITCMDLGYLKQEEMKDVVLLQSQVARMLAGLIRANEME